MKRYYVALILLALVGCSSASKHSDAKAAATAETEANLTQTEAASRREIVGDVAYTFDVTLDAATDAFKATSTATFDVKSVAPLFFDFKLGAQIASMKVNGAAVDVPYKDHRLLVPASALHTGSNTLEMTYVQPYSHDGRGLHRFVDPEDKNVYLYTQFETFDAHQMFPCFDQPDIKGTMTMTVTAPAAWKVITTTRESNIEKNGEVSKWTFPTTPKLSTYLFSLHAGPYQEWKSNAGEIPLRLFARQSLAKYVKTDEWFSPTQKGLKFYGHYFQYAYPFKKFDEIIAPDFNAGAMENVAAITFSERYVRRGPSTREEREGLASVILHEMAHMWFGDLVTMKWWNGLWLNESFATFMSAYSEFNATDFKEEWQSFYRHEKLWAYFTDQLVTTHPIEADVPDIATGFTNFDGITYGKGASVLKQLNFLLGETNFRNGVRYYFKQHAYQNTVLADFIGALEHASGRDLKDWSHAWLEQAGLDSVLPVYACASGRVTTFAMKATGPEGAATPRVHKTSVRLYDAAMRPVRTIDVEYKDGVNEVAKLKGAPCPAFVDANYDDHDYVKVQFDARSLSAIQTSVMKLPATFDRLRIWPALQQMVRDQQLAPQEYLKVAETAAPLEKDVESLEQLVEPLSQMIYYLPQDKTTVDPWIAKFEDILWKRASTAAPGSDLQKSMLMRFTDFSRTPHAADQLVNFLDGHLTWKGLALDQDRRWNMLVHLSALGDSRAPALVEHEKTIDGSEIGIQSALAADAAWPSADVKRKWFNTVLTSSDLKYARARSALASIFPYWQDSLKAALTDDYFKALPDFAARRQVDIVGLFTRRFDPAVCTQDSADRMGKFLADHPSLPPTVTKQMKMDRQEDERCAHIRARK